MRKHIGAYRKTGVFKACFDSFAVQRKHAVVRNNKHAAGLFHLGGIRADQRQKICADENVIRRARCNRNGCHDFSYLFYNIS